MGNACHQERQIHNSEEIEIGTQGFVGAVGITHPVCNENRAEIANTKHREITKTDDDTSCAIQKYWFIGAHAPAEEIGTQPDKHRWYEQDKRRNQVQGGGHFVTSPGDAPENCLGFKECIDNAYSMH